MYAMGISNIFNFLCSVWLSKLIVYTCINAIVFNMQIFSTAKKRRINRYKNFPADSLQCANTYADTARQWVFCKSRSHSVVGHETRKLYSKVSL